MSYSKQMTQAGAAASMTAGGLLVATCLGAYFMLVNYGYIGTLTTCSDPNALMLINGLENDYWSLQEGNGLRIYQAEHDYSIWIGGGALALGVGRGRHGAWPNSGSPGISCGSAIYRAALPQIRARESEVMSSYQARKSGKLVREMEP